MLFSLALPTIIANVVNALYNIVDQIFIGQGVGKLGNAATSVAFPLTTVCIITRIFLRPLLVAFGSTKDILPYAMEYSGITAFGMPF